MLTQLRSGAVQFFTLDGGMRQIVRAIADRNLTKYAFGPTAWDLLEAHAGKLA